MVRHHDYSGLLIIAGMIAIVCILIWINNTIDKKANKRAEEIFKDKEREFMQSLYLKEQNINNILNKKKKELDEIEDSRNKNFEIAKKLFEEKTIGFPWVAEQYSIYKTAFLDAIEEHLRTKRNPSIKGAEAVKTAKRQAKEAERKYFIMLGLVNYYECLCPWLKELQDAPDELIQQNKGNIDDVNIGDPAKKYMASSEWDNLPTQEKFQRALDRYWNRNKTKLEIGRLYERFIGYEYERDGWDVTFFGAIKGLEDLGRDLIVKKNRTVRIIQCKNWAADKTIHEKHIFQLFGTCILYELENHKKPKGIFVTSCNLSDTAKKCASMLGIDIIENKKLTRFPSIKCNIGKAGERIYHLPFDQQYDKIKIEKNKNEFYCETIQEAENAGFRRAFRWHGEA